MLATGTDENNTIISELYQGLKLVTKEPVKPYSKQTAFTLSDGSVSVLLETATSAASRAATVYCKVTGYGMAHGSVPFGTLRGSEHGLVAAIQNALTDANITAAQIDAVIGFANGHTTIDAIETAGLSQFFDLSKIPVLSVKERAGEGRAAAASLALAHGALLLHGDLTMEADAYFCKDGKQEKVTIPAEKLRRILVVSYAAGGSYTAVVLEK